MANLPYITEFPNKIFSALKMYSRVGAFPLDPTSVMASKADLESYINETGSYAYAGQVVAVANGSTASENGDKDYSLYVIRSDKSVQKLGAHPVFTSIATAEAWAKNNTAAVSAGETVTVETTDDEGNTSYVLYIIKSDRTLQRVSFDAADIPDMSWSTITGKPTSDVTDIDASVTFTKKFTEPTEDGRLTYNSKELAYFEDLSWDNIANKPTEFTPASHEHEAKDIKSVNASAITGTISIDNLPHGALERCVVVADDEARFALTTESIQTGDTVKVTGTSKMYFVKDDTKLDSEDGYEIYTAGSATSVPWSGVENTPTTLSGYGITDAVNVSVIVTEASAANAGKLLALNADGKLDVSITGDAATVGGKAASDFATATHSHAITDVTNLETELNGIKDGTSIKALDATKLTGTIDVARLPKSAFSKVVTVADDVERLALTTTQVQNYDTVIVESTKNMYFVVDETNLTSEAGYAIYTGSATSIPWSGVTSTPTTLSGYGITDAVLSTDVVETATANKILKLNSEAKLPASITGDAATVSGKAASDFAAATHTHNDDDLNGISWSKVTSTPTTLSGYGITDAVASSDIVTVAEANKILKLDANAKLPTDITGDAATVGGKAASDFAAATHSHAITDVTNLETELNGIKDGTSITALDAAKLTGTIDVARLPHGALERCVVVADDTARLALTTEQVQTGDTVKVTATSKMYFITDDTKLGTEDAFEVYTAGSATSVPWSGITGKPEFGTEAGQFAEGNHTHTAADVGAVATTDVVDTATVDNAGKLLKINADGKLDASITGGVDWSKIENGPSSTAENIDKAVEDAEHTNRDVLDKLSEDESGNLVHNSKDVAYVSDISKFMQVSETEPEDLPTGGFWFEIVSQTTEA